MSGSLYSFINTINLYNNNNNTYFYNAINIISNYIISNNNNTYFYNSIITLSSSIYNNYIRNNSDINIINGGYSNCISAPRYTFQDWVR